MTGDFQVRSANHVRARAAVLCGLALAASVPADATNGYFSHGYSVAQRALGGAGSAYASDALTVAVNPANIAFVPARFDVNLGLFTPVRAYTAGERGPEAGPGVFSIGPGTDRSAHDHFMIPAMAYAAPLTDRSSWGLAFYGNGGMNTDYRGNSASFAEGITGFETRCEGTFGGGPTSAGAGDNGTLCGYGATPASVDLIQSFIVPSYAHRIGEDNAIGIAPVIAVQRFSAKGLKAFARFSNTPDAVSEAGYSYSYGAGARVGVTLNLIPYVTFGGSYQTRIEMSEFEEYRGLFAEQGDFDVPSNWNFGAVVGFAGRHRVLLDYQKVNFSEVRAVGNRLDPNRFVNECALPRLGGNMAPSDACLGADAGPGFGWGDVATTKLGYELLLGDLQLRGGYSRNHQPIPADEVLFNVLAPAVIEQHFTGGVAYRMDDAWSLEMSATYARNRPTTGKNPLSHAEASEADLLAAVAVPGSGGTENAFGIDPQDQDIRLDMRQYELMLGLAYRF